MFYAEFLDQLCHNCGTTQAEHEKAAPFKCLIRWDGAKATSGYNFKSFNAAGGHFPRQEILARSWTILKISGIPDRSWFGSNVCRYCGCIKGEHKQDGSLNCVKAWHGGLARAGYHFESFSYADDIPMYFIVPIMDRYLNGGKMSSGGVSKHISTHSCQCGAWSTGVQDYEPGHSAWCPTHDSKKAKK